MTRQPASVKRWTDAFPKPDVAPSIRKLARLVRIASRCIGERMRGPIDILYYPPSGGSWTGLLRDLVLLGTIRPLARRTVFHFHAGGFDSSIRGLPRGLKPLAARVFEQPDVAIVLSPSLAKEVDDIRPKRVEVIANGIDDTFPAGANRPRETTPLKLLYVGTVSRAKGVSELVRAAAALMRDGLDLHLDVLGGSDEPEFMVELKDLVATSGVTQQIHFRGPQTGSEKWAFFREAAIFCFPTHYPRENQPVAVIEAMMAGLPIVATRWRALPDLVRHEQEGLLIPTGDADALADGLRRLCTSPALRARYGSAARARFEAEFTLEHHLDRLEHSVRSTLA